MVFSILQVSRDDKRLLTVSVRHLSSEVHCQKGHCLKTVQFNRCTRVLSSRCILNIKRLVTPKCKQGKTSKNKFRKQLESPPTTSLNNEGKEETLECLKS